MAFLFQKFQEGVKVLAKSTTFAKDPRSLQFEADINRLFLYTSYNRLGKDADEADAEEIIDMASKASLADQQKLVQENIHSQFRNFCTFMDKILGPEIRGGNELIESPVLKRSGLSLAVGRTSGSLSNRPVYDSDGEPRTQIGDADMSVFKDAVQDCMDYDAEAAKKSIKEKTRLKNSNDPEVEKYSGLRIRKQLVSPEELSNHFADIRFVRLSAIKNLIRGDTISGSWATVGVLTEKGTPRMSSAGKNYCIWKIGCLDEQTISVFLFGDAYQQHSKEPASTVLAFFDAIVRKDSAGSGFSISVFKACQVLKIGTSADYAICKGKRKDGMACTVAIDKRRSGIYCSFHRSNASNKYSNTRAELKGGNLKTAFRNPYQKEGIYMFDPLGDRTNLKPKQPMKLLSVEGLKKALSKGDQVTTNVHSQGLRFLTEVTGNMKQRDLKKENTMLNNLKKKRPSVTTNKSKSSFDRTTQMPEAKRKKSEPVQASAVKSKESITKMIELDFVSSDDEL